MSAHLSTKIALDTIIPTDLKHLSSMIYAYKSEFALSFLTLLKYKEIEYTPWLPSSHNIQTQDFSTPTNPLDIKDLLSGHKRRLLYLIPVFNPIGPKETKCIVNETIMNTSKTQLCVESITQTPDVPSGTCFQARIRFCLLHYAQNKTRLIVSSSIEYLKSSWIKMALDRAVPEGVKDYHTQLEQHLIVYLQKSVSVENLLVEVKDVLPPVLENPQGTSQIVSAVKRQSVGVGVGFQRHGVFWEEFFKYVKESNVGYVVLVLFIILLFLNVLGVVLLLRILYRVDLLAGQLQEGVRRTEL
jgi:hypothetical protein